MEKSVKEGYIVYFDETGDDGNNTDSSNYFLLTSIYMPMTSWQKNFDILHSLRSELNTSYNFHVKTEMHTKHFLTNKHPYKNYNWTIDEKQSILIRYIKCISSLDIKVINVIIDKTKIKKVDYPVLENALKYNIQRIENSSADNWMFIAISDDGRIKRMNRIARQMRKHNPIQSMFDYSSFNLPIHNMIEDILPKNSSDSPFIQVCDFLSYFTYLFYKCTIKNEELPNRVRQVIDKSFIRRTIQTFKEGEILNLKANKSNPYGIVIYPK